MGIDLVFRLKNMVIRLGVRSENRPVVEGTSFNSVVHIYYFRTCSSSILSAPARVLATKSEFLLIAIHLICAESDSKRKTKTWPPLRLMSFIVS